MEARSLKETRRYPVKSAGQPQQNRSRPQNTRNNLCIVKLGERQQDSPDPSGSSVIKLVTD
jgi:hypothetical protein